MARLDGYMKDLPLLAILRGITPGEVTGVADMLVEAGITMIEVPLNSPDACVSIQKLARRYGNETLVGAGTVLRTSEVGAVKQVGAGLVVSPNMDTEVISETKRLDMVSFPGSCTPTEILNAIAAGADAVKLFPSELISPAAVGAIRAVLPSGFPLFAVGGIHAENMPGYAANGVAGFGIGSALYMTGKPLAQLRRDAGLLAAACKNSLQ